MLPISRGRQAAHAALTTPIDQSCIQNCSRFLRAAHVAMTQLQGDTEVGIFGVFDGHGACCATCVQ